jgi:RND superfamily putative drug exporter
MGRWSADHWKTATFGWLALVLVAFALGSAAGMTSIDDNAPGPGESGRMDRILDAGFKQPAGESVLIQSRSLRAGDPAFRAAIADVVAGVSKFAAVQHVRKGDVSKDRHAALVEFDIRGDKDKAVDKIEPVVKKIATVQRAHEGFVIGEFGDASSQKGVETAFGDDLAKAGTLSLPITLIILVLAFGTLVAAGIPLLLALTAVFATFGLVSLSSKLVPVAMAAPAMVLLIGLAVGVDYSMFYLRRERQERAAGRSERAALEAAAATSGRSVLISGFTVIVAMAGMFLTGDATFQSLGLATILVVAVAVLGSLTVLPALLSRLGDNVDRLRVPLVGRLRRDDGDGRFWGAIVDRVLRRPLLSAILAGGLLLALAAPALQLHLAAQGTESFPKSLAVIKTYDRMQQAFPGTALPANVVVKAPDVHAPAVQAAIGRLERRAVASGRAFEPITVDVNKDATVANVTIPIAGNGTDAASKASFRVLRKTIVPETVGAVPNTEAGVTGQTAKWQDESSALKSSLLPVVAFVLLFAFALMLVAFRSIVVAVKAILLNLLSVAAAYGVLVLVFQHGVGKGLLGGGSADGIEAVVPLLLFVILFGLSMDYHVFIISRIRERFDRGASMDEAVAQGIKSTAGVVTSAALVMVAVFAVFGTLSMPFFKQFGVGLAAAVLLDATIVRAVLLPATMKLLGESNWYLPRWLEWLPKLDEYEPEPVSEPEPESKPEPAPEQPRSRKPKRRIGFARMTGLVLIALLVIGLAYLKFAPSSAAVSVPAGAKAGQLILHPCHYGTEKGSYAADCGTLVVPENRAKRGSRLIALPVVRIHARSAHPGPPVFRLEGGPGISNMHFKKASRFAEHHDVVLVGYRGVDGSVRLDCPEVASALKRSVDFLGQKSFRAYSDGFRSCAARLAADGIDLVGYGMPQQVDDFEAARKALGYRKIDLLSESAGTRLALIYAWRYPKSIHRSVLIGVNPPGHFLWYPKTTDEQIRRYARLCAEDASCSKRTDDLTATLKRTEANVPGRFWGLPIRKSSARIASFYGLMESSPEAAPLSGPMTIDAWLSAANGDASGLWFEAFLARFALPESFVWGELAAVARADAGVSERYYSSHADRGRSIIGNPAADFIMGRGGLMRAWPANATEDEYDHVRTSRVETLLVGGALDFTTPPQIARRELLPHLPNGHQVVLPGLGHTTSFWAYEPKASGRLVNAFLDSGKVDTSLYTPAKVDFTPEVTQTALGKGFVGAMLALPAVVVISLLLMWRRTRKRGRFGRKASILLRSLYTLVLGLGGWFAGLVLAQFAFPALPLDSALLAVVSIGVPTGLGIYLAWVNRTGPPRARRGGLSGALTGALLGAFLGFHATAGLLAVVSTIVGAAVGANLVLLVLDISWDRQVRDPSVGSVVTERLEPHPSIG